MHIYIYGRADNMVSISEGPQVKNRRTSTPLCLHSLSCIRTRSSGAIYSQWVHSQTIQLWYIALVFKLKLQFPGQWISRPVTLLSIFLSAPRLRAMPVTVLQARSRGPCSWCCKKLRYPWFFRWPEASSWGWKKKPHMCWICIDIFGQWRFFKHSQHLWVSRMFQICRFGLCLAWLSPRLTTLPILRINSYLS